jgi:hypothetical protein
MGSIKQMTPVRRAPMKHKPVVHKKTPAKRRREFSKCVIIAMILLWFAGALFGGWVVTVQVLRGDYGTDLSSLLIYIGAVMTSGAVGYYLQAGLVNPAKIKAAAATGQYRADYSLQQPNNNDPNLP